MPLQILGARHFEHGETYSDLVNQAANTPVTDEISTVSPDDGVYCKRYELAGNDDVRYESPAVFTRPSTSSSMMIQTLLKPADVTSFDYLAIYFWVDSGGAQWPLSFRFNSAGGGEVVRHSSSSSTSTSGTTLATWPSGTLLSGVPNWITCRLVQHDTTGVVQMRVNGATVVSASGLDTNHTGSVGTSWGWQLLFSSVPSGLVGTVDLRMSNLTFAQDGTLADLKPQRYKAYVPDGVTAANDGVIFGGAPTKQAALGEIPGTSADGINLNSSGHSQGLTYPTPSETNIRTVHAMGQVGDSAAGSEQFRCDIGDGVGTDTGPTLGATASFAGRRLSNFVHTPPGAASWDAAAADLTATLVRTA